MIKYLESANSDLGQLRQFNEDLKKQNNRLQDKAKRKNHSDVSRVEVESKLEEERNKLRVELQ